ncbi:NAD(P)H-dependent oxidoreductase [Alisedimentitalea sp. MJ-SS2]|uniref:NADPH-dependent FMN reductase n=1 Tax=Aliisedimentitalea sp. MJ-SS2 TaxID=3049795 RepID=UPI002912D1D4|nr:NAD(P)H-dependent oxidoreductase [Alisedimentitalea sp. MJ-SS2]MDU8928088.1 NAD(P)H-dependent oxidoreductase [Alisedimentitalea sp. MJ-SS2]
MTQPTLLGLCGSLRAGSQNRKLMHVAARAFGEAEFTVADLNLPLYNGDDEDAHGIPAAVQTLAEQIAEADAVIIVTPEYNKAPSGVLKNALDWVSRVKGMHWKGKPVAIMSVADGRAGGERAQVILRAMMTPFRPRLLPGPELAVADGSNQFDDEGHLASERYQKTLGILMRELRAEISD